MQDFEELKKAKQRCVDELVEALSRYRERLDEIDHRLVEYIEDAISNNASHANLYELLGIRKELRLMDSYDLDPERVKRSLRAIEGQWANGRHVKGGLFLKYLNFLPDYLEHINKNAYLCIVKILKGHEAAAPNKAAYFVPTCKENYSGNRVR